jgi:carboxypeptidase Q
MPILPREGLSGVARASRTTGRLVILLAVSFATTATVRGDDIRSAYSEAASRIIGEAFANRAAWQRLAVLTDTIGHRLSGSPQLDQAIQWAVAEMTRDGLEGVRTEPVMVPRWVRGAESATIVRPGPHPIAMLGLGGSIATPPEGLEAEVLAVASFDELDARRAEAAGRIVLFNTPFTTYPQSVDYRYWGAVRAAKYGAAAALIRSIGPRGFRTPHTGALRYSSDVPMIPAAAVSVEDAERLQRLYDAGRRPVVRLMMEARSEPDVPSANVIAELVGRERPDEIVLMGGHLDSWDVGTGASDDGGGCIAVWEALRILKKLGLRPRRTIRVVLFTNEENGTRGGLAYRDAHLASLKNHVLMMESDTGVFRPHGFGFTGTATARATIARIARLLTGIGADHVGPSGGGADIGPSVQAANLPAMSLEVDMADYFLLHHTAADTIDHIDPVDLSRAVAALGVMAYVVADLPARLGE